PKWGLALFSVAAAVIASHVMLPSIKLSWPSKGVISVSVAIIAGGVIHAFEPLHRPFDLYRANLKDHWLVGEHLRRADLRLANLSSAFLAGANLTDADLTSANVSGAKLSGAKLSGADLSGAKLSGVDLRGAKLSDDLRRAGLSGVELSGADLSGA